MLTFTELLSERLNKQLILQALQSAGNSTTGPGAQTTDSDQAL